MGMGKRSLRLLEIKKEIQRRSRGRFRPKEGSIFLALDRLWEYLEVTPVTGSKKVKQYALNDEGRKSALKRGRYWRKVVDGIELFLEPKLENVKFQQVWEIFREAVAVLRRHPAKDSFLDAWDSLLKQLDELERSENEIKEAYKDVRGQPISSEKAARFMEFLSLVPIVPFDLKFADKSESKTPSDYVKRARPTKGSSQFLDDFDEEEPDFDEEVPLEVLQFQKGKFIAP